MACNDLMGLPDPFPRRRDRTGRTWQEPADDRSLRAPRAPARLARAGLALLDPEAWELAWDFEVLRQLAEEPGLDPAWAGRLLAELDRFARTWVAGDRATWPEARAILGDLLAHRNAGSAHEVTAIGHAHIDTAWLWPLAETRRKIVRSWSSQLALMDRYPEHRFAASSAQHYAWLEQDAPGLYERLRERVREGRWEVVGGSWVEPDLNLPSRRVARAPAVYGQRDLQERFGARCREFWTPDTFGYNGQVPQILRGAGIDRFLTQKLSWNQFTEPPHHSFAWAGIDGSEVLVHMPPADTYNAELSDRRAARERRALQGPRPHGAAACSCSATATAAAGRRRRCSSGAPRAATCRASRACSSRRPRSSSTGSRRTSATPRADRRRAVLRVPPRHLHEPGAHQARQPRRRAAAARGGGRRGARAPARPRGLPGARSCARCGRRCCSTSSTTSSRAARSARSTRTPSATTRASPPARPSCATRRSPRSATASPRR